MSDKPAKPMPGPWYIHESGNTISAPDHALVARLLASGHLVWKATTSALIWFADTKHPSFGFPTQLDEWGVPKLTGGGE